MPLFQKPAASHFLSLKSPTPQPVQPLTSQSRSLPCSPQPHKCLTCKTQSLAKLKGISNIVWVNWWEEGASVHPDTEMVKVIIYKIKQLGLGTGFLTSELGVWSPGTY